MAVRSTLIVIAAALAAFAPRAGATARSADGVVNVSTETKADSVTVGQRFDVVYRLTFPDSLKALTPEKLPSGSCRLVSASWKDAQPGARVGRATFMPVSLDSVVVPSFPIDFVAPDGDTLRAWTDRVDLPLKLIAADSKDLKPLKQQWQAPRNWLAWIAAGLGALALIAAAVWWFRRRRRRGEPVAAPEVRLPPDFVALTELERIEAMGLVERGEYKAFYTRVVDVIRRYIEERFGVEAMDRTTGELLDDLARHGKRIDGLGALMNEADLVKFAKFTPAPASATAAIASARSIVIATTPKPEPAPAPEAQGATG